MENTVTVETVEQLAKKIAELRTEVDAEGLVLKEKKERLERLENDALSILKDLGKTSYKSEFGTLTKVQKWRVNLPQGNDNRQKFFEYLKAKGQFDSLITVNSNTLNSYFMEEWENVKKSAPEDALSFSLPGIDEPKVHEILSFRRK